MALKNIWINRRHTKVGIESRTNLKNGGIRVENVAIIQSCNNATLDIYGIPTTHNGPEPLAKTHEFTTLLEANTGLVKDPYAWATT